jgi:LPXTG-motif cell wall-anchored protein
LAIAGVDPHLLVTFAIIDLLLGIGAWILVRRKA